MSQYPLIRGTGGRVTEVNPALPMSRDVPLLIAAGERFHIPNNIQVLYAENLDIEGEIEDHGGSLVEVN